MRLALGMVLLATVAHAGPAEVAATLRTGAEECRYLRSLCKRAGTVGAQALADAPGVSVDMAQQALDDVYEAAPVIRAKHDQAPKCFRECVDTKGRPLLPPTLLE